MSPDFCDGRDYCKNPARNMNGTRVDSGVPDNGAITATSERAHGGRESSPRVTCDTESNASDCQRPAVQSTPVSTVQYASTARWTSPELAEHGGGAAARPVYRWKARRPDRQTTTT